MCLISLQTNLTQGTEPQNAHAMCTSFFPSCQVVSVPKKTWPYGGVVDTGLLAGAQQGMTVPGFGFGNEPEGDSLRGNYQLDGFVRRHSIFHSLPIKPASHLALVGGLDLELNAGFVVEGLVGKPLHFTTKPPIWLQTTPEFKSGAQMLENNMICNSRSKTRFLTVPVTRCPAARGSYQITLETDKVIDPAKKRLMVLPDLSSCLATMKPNGRLERKGRTPGSCRG